MKSASQMKSLRDEIFFEDDILAPLGLNFLFEKIWLAQVDSNHRPRAYQARALTTWAMSQYIVPSAMKNEKWIMKIYRWNLILLKFLPFFFSLLSYLLSLISSLFYGGGDDGIRTHDPLLAGQVLSQLSYTPIWNVSSSKRSFKIEQKGVLQPHSSLGICQSLTFPVLHRKEVIQPHLPIRLPCYDLTPIIEPTFDGCLLAVSSQASGVPNFHGLTGGVYKARERIHRGMLIRDY